MIEMKPVDRKKLREFIPEAAHHIKTACERTGRNMDDLLYYCINDPSFFCVRFYSDNKPCGVCIISITQESLHVDIISGDLPDGWTIPVDSWFEHIAKASGLNKITGSGRKGWKRLLAPLGYEVDKDGFYWRCF